MTKQTQQMPLKMSVGNIQALTTDEIAQIEKYIQLGTIFDVEFKDADGVTMLPVAYKPETLNESGVRTAAPVVTVLKGGSVVDASIEPTFVKFGLIVPDDSVGTNGTTKDVFFGALFSDGEVKLCIDKTTTTKCPLGSTTKATNKYSSASFVIAPSPAAAASTTIAIDTIPNVAEVKALATFGVEQALDATDGLEFNGKAIPVAVKVDDVTPIAHTIKTTDVIMKYNA